MFSIFFKPLTTIAKKFTKVNTIKTIDINDDRDKTDSIFCEYRHKDSDLIFVIAILSKTQTYQLIPLRVPRGENRCCYLFL